MMDTSHLLSSSIDIDSLSSLSLPSLLSPPSLSLSLSSTIESASTILSQSQSLLRINLTPSEAEALAGPFFGLSLFPYLAFLYFLNVPENNTPKGVTVGFATCLLFVFLTIPAAIAAKVLYGVSLADSDWLHGSAESLLTVTNLVTVVAFRQAMRGKEEELERKREQELLIGAGIANGNGNGNGSGSGNGNGDGEMNSNSRMPLSATSYQPMINLVAILTALAGVTALVPALMGPEVHTPYLNGFMDLPRDMVNLRHDDPINSLTIAW